ncbi:flagellar basal body protein [Phenylobacterium sp.]|uniref:flagellar basal body protein n=1 Tax=Phenylobacterium sp. TaxID=1871053 RepID=UPI00286C04C8|nr:flagellar basal body protein [Phenylobacterium sp.]
MSAVSADAPDSAAAERVEQLTLLTERLTGLVALGAQAFEARRPQDAIGHVEETGRLANMYRHESARVRGNPALIAGASRVQRARLIRATEAFDAVLARQTRAVAAAQFITEGLVHAIADEVAAQRQQSATYGPGALAAPTAAATAITLNKRA